MNRVVHPTLGEGVVLETKDAGYRPLVRFNSGQVRWVLRPQVRFQAAVPTPEVAPTPPIHPHRRLVEALRLGVVPEEFAVDGFVIDRDAEQGLIRRWLSSFSPQVLLVVGGYGTGKNHLLQTIRFLALKEGYACALAELDPDEASLHRPKQVYRRWMRSFAFHDPTGGRGGYRELLEALGWSGLARIFGSHRLLGRVFDALGAHGPERWAALRWVEGADEWFDGIRLPDEATAANIYCNILTVLSWGVRYVLRRKGLVLLLDEAEVWSLFGTSYQRAKGRNFLRGLVLVCQDASELADDQPVLSAAGWRGRRTGLQYSGRYRDIPYVWRRPPGLRLVLAFTPVPEPGGLPSELDFLTGAARPDLEPLDDRSLRQAFEQIRKYYGEAYAGFQPPDRVVELVFRRVALAGEGRTRRFFKAVVEALDLIRLNPGVSPGRLLG